MNNHHHRLLGSLSRIAIRVRFGWCGAQRSGGVVAPSRPHSSRFSSFSAGDKGAPFNLSESESESKKTRYYVIPPEGHPTSKPGDHFGAGGIRAGTSTTRRGEVYLGHWYLTCCGAFLEGYALDDYDEVGMPMRMYSLDPCTRGVDGMYHPGKLVPVNIGQRSRKGAGQRGGYLEWSCCQERVPTPEGKTATTGCKKLPAEKQEQPDETSSSSSSTTSNPSASSVENESSSSSSSTTSS